jgi:hypothetical protein
MTIERISRQIRRFVLQFCPTIHPMAARTLILILFVASVSAMEAAPRPWLSADGARSVQGEFVKRDASSVTILRSDRREISIPLEKLHPDDRAWLNANHPLPGAEPPAADMVFDKLKFGDSRSEVFEKLKDSKFVELTVAETFLGRSGLNGVFRTRHKIGGLDAMLFFDWTEDQTLKEVTLQTAAMPAGRLKDQLEPCWKDFIKLLTTIHGEPIHANPKLEIAPIEDGAMSSTHLWKLDGTGTAMLGAAREGSDYQIAVRFTRENIKPIPIPATAQDSR